MNYFIKRTIKNAKRKQFKIKNIYRPKKSSDYLQT